MPHDWEKSFILNFVNEESEEGTENEQYLSIVKDDLPFSYDIFP